MNQLSTLEPNAKPLASLRILLEQWYWKILNPPKRDQIMPMHNNCLVCDKTNQRRSNMIQLQVIQIEIIQ